MITERQTALSLVTPRGHPTPAGIGAQLAHDLERIEADQGLRQRRAVKHIDESETAQLQPASEGARPGAAHEELVAGGRLLQAIVIVDLADVAKPDERFGLGRVMVAMVLVGSRLRCIDNR
jgi:hypothetical protein